MYFKVSPGQFRYYHFWLDCTTPMSWKMFLVFGKGTAYYIKYLWCQLAVLSTNWHVRRCLSARDTVKHVNNRNVSFLYLQESKRENVRANSYAVSSVSCSLFTWVLTTYPLTELPTLWAGKEQTNTQLHHTILGIIKCKKLIFCIQAACHIWNMHFSWENTGLLSYQRHDNASDRRLVFSQSRRRSAVSTVN